MSQESPLASHQGYLLIELDVGGEAPSIEFGKTPASAEGFGVHKVDLKNQGRFLLIPLSSGTYEVTRVNAPYFDLPFYKETRNDPHWEFKIEKQKTTYFGILHINPERSRSYIEIRRLNRIASSLADITAQYQHVLDQYPLTVHAGYRDDFFMELEAKSKGE